MKKKSVGIVRDILNKTVNTYHLCSSSQEINNDFDTLVHKRKDGIVYMQHEGNVYANNQQAKKVAAALLYLNIGCFTPFNGERDKKEVVDFCIKELKAIKPVYYFMNRGIEIKLVPKEEIKRLELTDMFRIGEKTDKEQ